MPVPLGSVLQIKCHVLFVKSFRGHVDAGQGDVSSSKKSVAARRGADGVNVKAASDAAPFWRRAFEKRPRSFVSEYSISEFKFPTDIGNFLFHLSLPDNPHGVTA